MALTEKRTEARERYITKNISCCAIAKELGLDVRTVYRWKAEDAEKGEGSDWEHLRQIRAMSFMGLQETFREAIVASVAKVKGTPEELMNPKFTDSLSKMLKSMEKIDPRSQYLSAVADLIKIMNRWLSENKPELKAQLDPYWEAIYQELVDYSRQKWSFFKAG